MTRAYQGYYSDYVLSTAGAAVQGATVNLYLASQFTVPPFPTGSTGQTPVAVTGTAADGSYSFDKLIPDDYYIQVVYTPAGGSTLYVWKYQVPIFTYEETRRTRERGLGTAIVRTLAKLHSGQNVLICCVGDSITVGYNSSGTVTTGYVADLAAGLAGLYPTATVKRLDPNSYGSTSDAAIPSWTTNTLQTGSGTPLQTITVVNCGVSGDTCLRVMRRFANITANGYPDLVTIYLGVNDSLVTDQTKYVDAPSFQAQLAALVNQVLSVVGCEVLLIPLHFNDNVGHTLPALEPYADASRAVAAQFRCGFVDVRKLWLDHYDPSVGNSGFGTWLDPTAGNYTHPTDLGHQIIATELLRAFQTQLEVPVGGAASPGGFSAGKTLELVRLPWESAGILNTVMAFQGIGWGAHQTFQNSPQLASTDANGLGTEFLTSHTGDGMTAEVRCTEVYMLCRRWTDSGMISVYIDGSPVIAALDMYRQYPQSVADLSDYNGAVAPQDRMLLATGLSDKSHAIVLTQLGSKNPLSSNYYWRFDALEVVRPRKHGYEVEGVEACLKIQRGYVTVNLSSQSYNYATVVFPIGFNVQNGVPTVVATSNNVNYYAIIGAVYAGQVQIYLVRRDGTNVTDSQTVTWIAVAP